jgi:hypothetical protein
MAKMSYEDLVGSLRQDGYTARTDEQLQQEAQQRVGETYDTMRGAAQQRQAIIQDAYERETQALADALATGQQAVAGQTARANAAIDDYIYGRSMQRTSYGAAAKGSVTENMQKAAALMQQQHDTATGGIENRKVLLAQQLGDTLAQYDKDFLTDVQAYVDAQKQLDYDRQLAADAANNALQMELFEASRAGSGGGGGGYRRSSGGGSPAPAASSGSLWDSLKQRDIYKTYTLNPSFGTVGQTTSTKKTGTSVTNTTKAALSTKAANSEKIAQKRSSK